MMADHTHIRGLHHVTAIASGAQANVDFYTRVLGLRLVKRTVNFDAPDTYHFYYGDSAGSPGSLLTFFPFEYAATGSIGAGMADTTAFAIPEAALDAWMFRLTEEGLDFEGPLTRFGAQTLGFRERRDGRCPRPSDRASILADTKGPQMRLGRRRGRESAGALPRRQTPHNQTSQ
jgi:glyoxalase family protein